MNSRKNASIRITSFHRKQQEPNSKGPTLSRIDTEVMTHMESMATMMKKRTTKVIWMHRRGTIHLEKELIPCMTDRVTDHVIDLQIATLLVATSITMAKQEKRSRSQPSRQTFSILVIIVITKLVQTMLVAEVSTSILEHQLHKPRSQYKTQVLLISLQQITITATRYNSRVLTCSVVSLQWHSNQLTMVVYSLTLATLRAQRLPTPRNSHFLTLPVHLKASSTSTSVLHQRLRPQTCSRTSQQLPPPLLLPTEAKSICSISQCKEVWTIF